jgi:hypothetical protein
LFCSKCGSQLKEGSVFCSRCGARVGLVAEQPAADVSPKSRLATTLLSCPWLFVGLFGAHRFYTGKSGSAVAMLLMGVAPLVCYFSAVLVFMAAVDEIDPPPLGIVLVLLSGVFGVAVGIWALIDFIIAATGNYKDSQGKVIKRW